MKNRRFKEIVLANRVEVVYTVLNTHTRFDGELIAEVSKVANNIAVNGKVIPNDCGLDTIPVSSLLNLKVV